MRLYYALFDQAEHVDGNYWTWASEEIRLPLLNKFQSDFAAKHWPPKPNALQKDDLWGGLVRLSDWTVVYRYYDGGYDKQQRPGRYVLLTAWIPVDDAQRVDLLPIFTNEVFQHVSNNAKNIPVPPPFALKEERDAEKINTDAYPFQDGKTPFSNLEQASRTFAVVPSQRRTRFVIADLEIIRTEKEQMYVLNVVPEPEPEKKNPDVTPIPPGIKKLMTIKFLKIASVIAVLSFVSFLVVISVVNQFGSIPVSQKASSPQTQQDYQARQMIEENFRKLSSGKQRDLCLEKLHEIQQEMLNSKSKTHFFPPQHKETSIE